MHFCVHVRAHRAVLANFVIDKFLVISKPVWVTSVDLTKTFDRVHWKKVWVALVGQGVFEHMLLILQRLYFNQRRSLKIFFPMPDGDKQVFGS